MNKYQFTVREKRRFVWAKKGTFWVISKIGGFAQKDETLGLGVTPFFPHIFNYDQWSSLVLHIECHLPIVSGDVACYPLTCNPLGLCSDEPIDVSMQYTQSDCLQHCKDTEGCGWYSINFNTSECILTASCDDVVQCGEPYDMRCLHGQMDCPLEFTINHVVDV